MLELLFNLNTISSFIRYIRHLLQLRPSETEGRSSIQSLRFWIMISILRYCSIGLRSNIIYGIFIFKLSYEDKKRNVSNIVWSFDTSVISCTVSIVNKSIHQTKRLFLLHSIHLYVNARTIVQLKYNIIIYTIYSSPIDKPFITIKRFINRWRIYCINDDIVFKLNNSSSIYVTMNRM